MANWHLKLRKVHRMTGLVLALPLLLQAISGLWLALARLLPGTASGDGLHAMLTQWAYSLHDWGGAWDGVFRVALGLGLMYMAVTGVMIFFKAGMNRGQAHNGG